MAKNFEELMAGVCKLLPISEPQRAIAGESIFIEDVMFTLIHDEKINPDRVFLFASFGPVPRQNGAKVLTALMKENHALFKGDGPGFTVSPTTGKIVYARNLALATLQPADLASKMCFLARKGNEWRETKFLDVAPSLRRREFAPAVGHA